MNKELHNFLQKQHIKKVSNQKHFTDLFTKRKKRKKPKFIYINFNTQIESYDDSPYPTEMLIWNYKLKKEDNYIIIKCCAEIFLSIFDNNNIITTYKVCSDNFVLSENIRTFDITIISKQMYIFPDFFYHWSSDGIYLLYKKLI